MNNLILEDAYNSDYIYSLIIALFYSPSDGMSKLINTDTNNSNTCYIQEYIKSKFIYPMRCNTSIESHTVNKLRNFIYNCGWNREDDKWILDKGDIDKFYKFLISDMMEYCALQFVKINPISNISRVDKFDMITITDKQLYQIDRESNIVSLSSLIGQWIKDEVIEEDYSYKFENIPLIIPVFLDIRDPNTGLNKKYINIMEGINFMDDGDKLQRMFIWEIHSIICQTEKGDYYTVTFDHSDNLTGFSDKQIPSNWKIDPTNITIVKKLMREIRFVFYKLQ